MRHLLISLFAAVVLVLMGAPFGSATGSQRDLLNVNDHLFVARAVAEGRASLPFVLACEPSATGSVAAYLSSMGSVVRSAIPKIGYVRADIPLVKLHAVMQNTTIELLDVLPLNQFDYDLQETNPGALLPASAEVPPADLPTPGPRTPAVNPFTALSDMGVPQFLKAHPTYDGRGTIVGFLEPVDPFAPGLQKARTLDGRIVPKIVMYRVDDSPFDPEGGGPHNIRYGWIAMNRVVYALHGRFVTGGKVYRAPHDGVFRLGFWRVNDGWAQFNEPDYQASRAIVPPLTFPVLWDEAHGRVWVNARQDGDFTTVRSIGDYRSVQDVSVLPVTYAQWSRHGIVTKHQRLSPTQFVVQIDALDHFLHFDDVGLSTHASMVGGSATGNGFFHGAFNGVAPGARIAVVDGYYPYMIEGLNALAASHVDVISMSFALTPYVSADGVLDRIVDRIIHTYNVQISIAAANAGPVTQSVEMPSTATAAISVGGYVSADAARYDEGAVFPYSGGMLAMYSSRGPANDGGMKPDLIAQTEWLTASSPEAPPQVFRQTLSLPRGYEVGGGTSQAAPTAAGTIALLISAAKQRGLPYSADLIKRALVTGARVLPYQRFEIGGGLIDMAGAWTALQRLSVAPPPHIDASAPVQTVTSDELSTPNTGRGIYLREGWSAGMVGTRAITYTLASNAPVSAYHVRVVGDTQTFSAPSTLTLQPGIPTALPIRIAPASAGIHSAIVELIDTRAGTVVDQRLCTVVAAERFSAANGFTIVHEGDIEHPGYRRYFLTVPSGTTAFTVDATVMQAGLASAFDPFTAGRFIEVTRPDGTEPPVDARYQPVNEGLHWAQEFDRPMPGVWELDVQNQDPSSFGATPQRAAPIPPTYYQLKAAVYRVAALESPEVGKGAIRVVLRNEMAPLHLHSLEVQLAHIRSISTSIVPGQLPRSFSFTVAPGTSQVFAQFTSVSADADVSVYLFNCAKNVAGQRESYFSHEPCTLAGSANWLHGDRLAATANPQSWVAALYPSATVPTGRWVVIVDARHNTNPISVQLRIGTVSLASDHEVATVGQRRSGDHWIASFALPPRHVDESMAALLDIHAAETLEIWQKNNADLITTMKKSKPKLIYRFGSVWSAIVPL